MNQESIIAFMPIRPIYANRIISGYKEYEFRRSPIRTDVSHIIIYASSPERKIIGVAEVDSVESDSPSAIWEKTKQTAGVTRSTYRDYFRGKKRAFAIRMKNIVPFMGGVSVNDIENNFVIPQSFTYVSKNFYSKVIEQGKNQRRNILFFGGIHGVGKSTMCQKLCASKSANYISASDLIIQYQESIERRDKKVKNIIDNQNILISEVIRLYDESESYILDGHFNLLDLDGQIQAIPFNTFLSIRPKVIAVLVDKPESIKMRLADRDNVDYEIKLLSDLQNREINYAREIGQRLGIQVYIVPINDKFALDKLTASCWNSK